MREKEKIIILGAGLFAEEVADYISNIEDYELIGFIEGMNRDRCRKPLLGLPVTWIDDVAKLIDSRSCKAVCAVGSTNRKLFIQQAISAGLEFTTIQKAAQILLKNGLLKECIEH